MREIKFRVWTKIGKGWVKNSSPKEEYGVFTPYNTLCNSFGEQDLIYQQFTGLKDKNKKDIYEGDIVKDLDKEFGVIEFQHGSFVLNTKNRIIPFWSVFVSGGMVYPRQINPETLEIFGNIFENPELLK